MTVIGRIAILIACLAVFYYACSGISYLLKKYISIDMGTFYVMCSIFCLIVFFGLVSLSIYDWYEQTEKKMRRSGDFKTATKPTAKSTSKIPTPSVPAVTEEKVGGRYGWLRKKQR